MPADLPVGYIQLAKIAMRIWEESRAGSDYDSMKELTESLIAAEAAGEGLGFFDMMKVLGSLKLAVGLIQESLETYLGPFVDETNHDEIFEIIPYVRASETGTLLVHFKTRSNVQTNPEPSNPATDQDTGASESGCQ